VSSAPAISVRALGKQYALGSARTQLETFREMLVGLSRRVWTRSRQLKGEAQKSDTIWALRDVEFDVRPGEVVGVIGRNGAGKSTLLKVLNRITEPTTGRIEVRGRVASLLEVGTGFHAELTGRENIFLNGAILGMSRSEIARKFDAIVEFAEIDRFLDTPVKRYSSGMYVRLAFAVAAHLESEILLVDEVLAVGDASFQKKCMGKMEDVAHTGKTVIFVSHNMAAVRGLCDRSILIEAGRVEFDGEVEHGVRRYLEKASGNKTSQGSWTYRHRGGRLAITSVELIADGAAANSVQAGDSFKIRIGLESRLNGKPLGEVSVSLLIYFNGQKVANLWTNYFEGRGLNVETKGFVDCTVTRWPFRSGTVTVDIYTHSTMEVEDWIEGALGFMSYDGDFYGSGVITNPDQGLLFLDHKWHVK